MKPGQDWEPGILCVVWRRSDGFGKMMHWNFRRKVIGKNKRIVPNYR